MMSLVASISTRELDDPTSAPIAIAAGADERIHNRERLHMNSPATAIQSLLDTGKEFTYGNFSTKSEYGYPSAYLPQWTAWRARVSGAIKSLFGERSASFRMVTIAERTVVLGNGPEKFRHAHSHYMGALQAALETLENDTFGELLRKETALATHDLTNKIFVVHGHDDVAKAELEIILREMGLEPVVLHRQADEGQTIIEKFEAHSDVGFAFILLTPDEIAYLRTDDDKADNDRKKEFRARPNVIWEFGYFVGRLTRKRTCCLYRGDVTLPSDLNGLIYKQFNKSVEEVGYSIRKELTAAGYKLA